MVSNFQDLPGLYPVPFRYQQHPHGLRLKDVFDSPLSDQVRRYALPTHKAYFAGCPVEVFFFGHVDSANAHDLEFGEVSKIDRLGSGHRQACCRVRVWQVVVDEYLVPKQFVGFALNNRRREDWNRVCVAYFRTPDVSHDAIRPHPAHLLACSVCAVYGVDRFQEFGLRNRRTACGGERRMWLRWLSGRKPHLFLFRW
jgi:hypothetical protein